MSPFAWAGLFCIAIWTLLIGYTIGGNIVNVLILVVGFALVCAVVALAFIHAHERESGQ